MTMNDNDHLPGRGAGADRAMNDPGRLDEYEARTREPLDLLAMATLWLVVVPVWDYGHGVKYIVLALRVALSVVYGIDLAIRSALAPRHVHYALTHPLALASVLYPPVRVFFSLRLVRSMFRRGHQARFLTAAAMLVLNGAIIVYLFERHAPGSNIHTLRDAVWWSFVTVTTVGYGDFTRSPPGDGSPRASSWPAGCSRWRWSPRRWRPVSSPRVPAGPGLPGKAKPPGAR
jgi:hypothetical protein